MVAKWDLTYKEWECLVRLYSSETVTLSSETLQRFSALGLTEPADGTALSATGRTFVEHELLMERRNRLQR